QWYNGQKIAQDQALPISFNNLGLKFGATVFTTLRVYRHSLDHPLTQWFAHCDRLKNSLYQFNWQEPNWAQVRQGAETLKAIYPVLRVTIFPDGQEWITGRELPPDLSDRQQKGTTAWVAPAHYQRSLPTHKTGNYLACWLALQEAQRQGATAAILTNLDDSWLETSTGNLWGWQAGCWWTPPLAAGILPGIVRSRLVKHLQTCQIPVQETPWTPELRKRFTAIAYSNSVTEIIPLRTILMRETRLEYNPCHSALADLRSLFEQGG
ncbi:aminotransferase class IV, partial [Almyronema epifaneia]